MSRCRPPPDIQSRYDEYMAARPNATCSEIEEALSVTPYVRRKLAKRWYAPKADAGTSLTPFPGEAVAAPQPSGTTLPLEVNPDEDPLIPWVDPTDLQSAVSAEQPLPYPVPSDELEPIGEDEELATRMEGADFAAMAPFSDAEKKERDAIRHEIRLNITAFAERLADVCGGTKAARLRYLAELEHMSTETLQVELDRCRMLVSSTGTLTMVTQGVAMGARVVESVGPYTGLDLRGYGAVVSASPMVNDLVKEVYIRHNSRLAQYTEPEVRLAGALLMTAIALDSHNRAAAESAGDLDDSIDPAAGVGTGEYDDL